MPNIYTMYVPSGDGVERRLVRTIVGSSTSQRSLPNTELQLHQQSSSHDGPLREIFFTEFDGTREEVSVIHNPVGQQSSEHLPFQLIHEVMMAPDKSTDNMISELKKNVSELQVQRHHFVPSGSLSSFMDGRYVLLQMHCTMLDECRSDYFDLKRKLKNYSIGIGVIGRTDRRCGRQMFSESTHLL